MALPNFFPNPRVRKWAGAPLMYFYPNQGPRRTFPGDDGDLPDLIGNTPAGARGNGVTYANGPDGQCLSSPGVDHVYFSGVAAPANANNFSITARFSLGTVSSYCAIWGDSGNDRFFGSNPSGQLYMQTNAGGNTVTGPTVSGTGWHHGATVKSSSGLFLYLDGVLVASSLSATGNSSVGSAFAIGGSPLNYNWIGLLGCVSFYGRPLTPDEVAREAADPYWRLRDDGTENLVNTLLAQPQAANPAAMLLGQ